MASIYRAFMEKLGRTAIEDYVGNVGDLFYDPDASIPTLKVSDGETPGGVPYQVVGGSGEYNQDSFKTIKVDTRDDIVADSQIDTLELVAGSNITITTDAVNDKITFASTDTNTGDVNQNAFNTVQVNGQNPIIANTVTDQIELVAGSNMTITTDAPNDKITLSATVGGDTNKDSFKTIKVDTRDDIVADSDEDTLEFVAGSNMTITTDAANDKITFTSTDTDTTYFVGDGGLSQYNLTYNLKTSYDTAYGWGNHASGGYLTSTGVLSSHTDVHTTAATNGQVLTWVNANSRWEPAAATGGGGGGSGGELNQNAFSIIDVSPGSEANILATSATDTLEIVGGANITLTTSGSALTIVATDTDTTYTVGDGGLTQNNLTNALKSNWNTAYGWGNHSGVGYLTSTGVLSSHTDVHTTAATDGQVLKWDNENTRWEPADDTVSIYTSFDSDFDTRLATKSTTNLSEGTNLYYTDVRTDARIGLANLFDLTDVASVVAGDDGKVLFYEHSSTSFKWKTDEGTPSGYNNTNWDTAYGWGNHASGGYLTSITIATDSINDTHIDFGTGSNQVSTIDIPEQTNLYYTNARADARITNAGSANWNTAYGWGDHSGAGYLSSTGVLSSHTDVHTTAATDGQVLKWDNANTRWAPAADIDTDTIYTTFDSDFDTRLGTKSTTNLAEGTNLYYTDARADARAQLKIDAVIDSAPGALDTLNELAAALGDDANFSTTVTNSIATKEPIITAGTNTQYYRGDKTFQTLNTTAVAEGTNLFYTNARADARITNAGSANWNTAYGWGDHDGAGYLSSTGVLSSHTDVHTTAATNGQVLKWDHGNTRWAPADDIDTDTTYAVGDGGLTQNNLTNTLKGYYDTAYTHSQSAHADATLAEGVVNTNGTVFSNYNTITGNVTTTTASAKNMFMVGQMSIGDNYTWSIAGDGVLQII